jgi:hypothetical protein
MAEILNFKKGSTIIKLNTVVTSLNVRGILMSHCGRSKNTEYMHLTGKIGNVDRIRRAVAKALYACNLINEIYQSSHFQEKSNSLPFCLVVLRGMRRVHIFTF